MAKSTTLSRMLCGALLAALLLGAARADPINLYEVDQALGSLEARMPSLTTAMQGTVSTMRSTSLAASDAMLATLAPAASNIVAPVYRRAADIELLAADMDRSSTIDIVSFVSNIQASLSTRVSTQGSFRSTVTAAVNGLLATQSAALMNSFNAATTARAAIKTDANNNRAAIQTQANSNLVAAFNTESARSVSDLSQQVSQIAVANGQLSTGLSSAVFVEATRANAACQSRAAAGQGSLPVQTGSNDFTSCTSGQAGSVYFSSGYKRAFMCDGSLWSLLPLYYVAFGDSLILNRVQAALLTHHLNQGAIWTLCWRGSQQATFGSGSASSTFHSLCNNKGATVTIAKTVAGRIGGGYTDNPWTSRGSYANSWEAFLWRVNPSSPNTFERGSLYYGSGYNYATYDSSSYCTTFGNGHDWYLDSTCKTGYFNANYAYYYAQGAQPYDSNWLFGSSSSWTLAEHEVYYLSK